MFLKIKSALSWYFQMIATWPASQNEIQISCFWAILFYQLNNIDLYNYQNPKLQFFCDILGYKFDRLSDAATDQAILMYHRIIESFKFAYARRSELGDEKFLNISDVSRKRKLMHNCIYPVFQLYFSDSENVTFLSIFIWLAPQLSARVTQIAEVKFLSAVLLFSIWENNNKKVIFIAARG